MRVGRTVTVMIVLILLAACSTYQSKPEMTYYHGQNIPEGFITVLRASPAEIEFEIRVKFVEQKLYHLVLDGNQPVSEGWFPTNRAGGMTYTVTMKPSGGQTFEPGKTYRLCIGVQNPQAVQMTSSNYPCLADFTFVFSEKS
jgi:hypothetical protein